MHGCSLLPRPLQIVFFFTVWLVTRLFVKCASKSKVLEIINRSKLAQQTNILQNWIRYICEGWWFPKVTALFGLELGLVPSDCILTTTSAALHTTEQSCIRVSFRCLYQLSSKNSNIFHLTQIYLVFCIHFTNKKCNFSILNWNWNDLSLREKVAQKDQAYRAPQLAKKENGNKKSSKYDTQQLLQQHRNKIPGSGEKKYFNLDLNAP